MWLKSYNQTFIEKIGGVLDRFIQKRWQSSIETTDTFYLEIYQLEQTLSKAPTRPMQRDWGHAELLEPITEQQKVVDMSG